VHTQPSARGHQRERPQAGRSVKRVLERHRATHGVTQHHVRRIQAAQRCGHTLPDERCQLCYGATGGARHIGAARIREGMRRDARLGLEGPRERSAGPAVTARAMTEEDGRLRRVRAHSDSARSWNFCIISGSCESAKAFWISSAMGSEVTSSDR
jgi:hypothetical protein